MWHSNSWNRYYSKQLPQYKDVKKLKIIENILKQLNPLVDYKDIIRLKKSIELAITGKAFVLQLGECAERIVDCFSKENILNFYKYFISISQIIETNLNIPVVKIGRIAGQFAKPRSNLIEKDNILSFRGEIINDIKFDQISREPNPDRMLLAYIASKEAIKYLEHACISIGTQSHNIKMVNIPVKLDYNKLYTSHEALLLNYEAQLTRKINSNYYNLGAHMLWLGARTSSLPSPHVEYLRGIDNPIGIKVHNSMSPLELINLINLLNPNNVLGKIILIIRLSNYDIPNLLPSFIKDIKKHKLKVLFMCDPMHGNTKIVGSYKVRYLFDLIENIFHFITICKNHSVYAGGLHLESTYSNVTECLGGETQYIKEIDLHKNYKTTCDPRLNYNQTVELIAKLLKFSLN